MNANVEEGSRVVLVSKPLASKPQPGESSQTRWASPPASLRVCSVCKRASPDLMARRCTGNTRLCASCRAHPDHRIMSEALLRKAVPWLDRANYPAPVGRVVNCAHPAFCKQRVYLWREVALTCVDLNLEIPE